MVDNKTTQHDNNIYTISRDNESVAEATRRLKTTYI